MKRNIELSIDQARELYKNCPEIKQLLLTQFTLEELEGYPISWEQVKTRDDWDDIYTSFCNLSDYFISLEQLIILKNIYTNNEYIDLDYYGVSTKPIYSIVNQRDRLTIIETYDGINHIFSFNDRDICEKFLNNFKMKLEEVKNYI